MRKFQFTLTTKDTTQVFHCGDRVFDVISVKETIADIVITDFQRHLPKVCNNDLCYCEVISSFNGTCTLNSWFDEVEWTDSIVKATFKGKDFTIEAIITNN